MPPPKSAVALLLLLFGAVFASSAGAPDSTQQKRSQQHWERLLRKPLRTSTTTTTPTAANTGRGGRNLKRGSEEKDLVNGMFEVVLSTLENKLRRVENLDRAVQHLVRKMDNLEKQVEDHAVTLLERVDEHEGKAVEFRTAVGRRLDYLAKKFDSVCEEDIDEVEDLLLASPSVRRSSRLPPNRFPFDTKTERQQRAQRKSQLDDVKTAVSGMDRKLALHINIVSENLGRLGSMVQEVHGAVIEEVDGDKNESRREQRSDSSEAAAARGQARWGGHAAAAVAAASSRRRNVRILARSKKSHNGTTTATKKVSKFDKLLAAVYPLNVVMFDVDEKVGLFKEQLSETKGAVDFLLPRAEELLQQNKRQEDALNEVKTELEERTAAIMQEIAQVEQELADTMGRISGGPSDAVEAAAPPRTPSRPLASSLFAVRRGRQPLDLEEAGSAAAYVTAANEFLTASGNVLGNATRHRQEDQFLIDGDTSDTRITFKRPSVIFPSVENKPTIVNSSFTYDAGKNQNGVTGYSCADLYDKSLKESGIYYLQIDGNKYWFLKTYCDMEAAAGGWTVIQRRGNYGEPRESFNRNWDEYKYGFGSLEHEFWLGNENIHMLTRTNDYELRIELEDFEGNKRYAEYKNFRMGSEKEQYRLEIGGYQGTAGDSLNDPWYGSNLRPFSTFDSDNDRSSLNCASMLKGGWWWKSCGRGLNGLYLNDPNDLTARQGIVWFRWRGWDYSLKKAQMMIRPKKFLGDKGSDDDRTRTRKRR